MLKPFAELLAPLVKALTHTVELQNKRLEQSLELEASLMPFCRSFVKIYGKFAPVIDKAVDKSSPLFAKLEEIVETRGDKIATIISKHSEEALKGLDEHLDEMLNPKPKEEEPKE